MDMIAFFTGIGIGITLAHVFVILLRGFNNIILKPSHIGEITDVNTFGYWSLYILIAILSPVVFVFKVIYILTHISAGPRANRRNRSDTVQFSANPSDIRKYDRYNNYR